MISHCCSDQVCQSGKSRMHTVLTNVYEMFRVQITAALILQISSVTVKLHLFFFVFPFDPSPVVVRPPRSPSPRPWRVCTSTASPPHDLFKLKTTVVTVELRTATNSPKLCEAVKENRGCWAVGRPSSVSDSVVFVWFEWRRRSRWKSVHEAAICKKKNARKTIRAKKKKKKSEIKESEVKVFLRMLQIQISFFNNVWHLLSSVNIKAEVKQLFCLFFLIRWTMCKENLKTAATTCAFIARFILAPPCLYHYKRVSNQSKFLIG